MKATVMPLHMKTSAKKALKSAKSRVFHCFFTLHLAKVVVWLECRRSGQKSKVHDHTLPGKKTWMKNGEILISKFRFWIFCRKIFLIGKFLIEKNLVENFVDRKHFGRKKFRRPKKSTNIFSINEIFNQFFFDQKFSRSIFFFQNRNFKIKISPRKK